MKLFISYLFVSFSGLFSNGLSAQDLVCYKQIDSIDLYLEVYYPEHFKKTEARTAMVFFHGGGWKQGKRSHFKRQALYFAKRGAVCFLVDYRTFDAHGTSPFEALKDAKSAIRFIRAQHAQYGIAPDKIVGVGGSAGGHLATATAMIDGYNEESDEHAISCKPDALVLFNPVIDNSPAGFGHARVGDAYKDFSPLHNIKRGVPPTLFLVGTEDRLIPVETAQYFAKAITKTGGSCTLKLYEKQAHSFFNYRNFEYYKATLLTADQFLVALDLLNQLPIIDIK